MERGEGDGWVVDILRETGLPLFVIYINLGLPLFFTHQSNSATIAKISRRVHIQGADTRTSPIAIKKLTKITSSPDGHPNQEKFFCPLVLSEREFEGQSA